MNKKFLLLLFFPAITIIFLLFWGNSESHRSHVKELHIKEKETGFEYSWSKRSNSEIAELVLATTQADAWLGDAPAGAIALR